MGYNRPVLCNVLSHALIIPLNHITSGAPQGQGNKSLNNFIPTVCRLFYNRCFNDILNGFYIEFFWLF